MKQTPTDRELEREIIRLKKEIGAIDSQINVHTLAIAGINIQIREIRQSGDVATPGLWLEKYTAMPSNKYQYHKLCIERRREGGKPERFQLLHVPVRTLKYWEKAIERREEIAKLRKRRKALQRVLKELYNEVAPMKDRLLQIQPTRKDDS